MSNVNAPYGLKPAKRLDGAPYAGAVTEIKINPAGLADNIFNGSVVYLSGGYIIPASDAGTAADPFVGVVGVFVGCEYTNDMGQVVHSQYYPANALNAKAKVVTDPMVLFRAQSSGTIDDTEIGAEVGLSGLGTAGSTSTGNATTSVGATDDAGASMTVVEIVTPDDTYTEVLVKINSAVHTFG